MAVTRLSLTDFRNHSTLMLEPKAQFTALHGANGAGKTNILEAISLLVPGRGLRRAALGEMVCSGGAGGFGEAIGPKTELGFVTLNLFQGLTFIGR